MASTRRGIPRPTALERAYERRLRKDVLDPLYRRINARVRAAQRDYEAIRKAIANIPADPNFAGLSTKAAQAHIAAAKRYHTAEFAKRMSAALGVNVKPLIRGKELAPYIRQHIRNNVALIKTIPKRYHAALSKNLIRLNEQGPFDQAKLRKMLSEQYGSAGYNLRRLTRDQTNKAIGQFDEIRQKRVGVEEYTWSTALDERVRETHMVNEGVTFRWDSPPATGHPGFEIQCFPGSVRIHPAGLQASVAYRYVGEVIEIRLADGVEVTATANHPILTESGWKRASDVCEGDKLIKHSRRDGLSAARLHPQLGDRNPVAQQLHRLLGGRGNERGARGRHDDLHGDPLRGQEEVDVVVLPRELRNRLDAMSAQVFGDLSLEATHVPEIALPRQRRTMTNLGLSSRVAHLLIRGASKFTSFVRRQLRHANQVLLRPRAHGQAQVAQTRDDHRAADAELGRHLSNRLLRLPASTHFGQQRRPAFTVETVAVVRSRHHDGLVYSFETATGLILANGIVTHNCRCIANPILPTKKTAQARIKRARQVIESERIGNQLATLTPEQRSLYERRRAEIYEELRVKALAEGKKFSFHYSSKIARSRALKEALAGLQPPPPPVVAPRPAPVRGPALPGLSPEQRALYNRRRKEIFEELRREAEAAGRKFSVPYNRKIAARRALAEAERGAAAAGEAPVAQIAQRVSAQELDNIPHRKWLMDNMSGENIYYTFDDSYAPAVRRALAEAMDDALEMMPEAVKKVIAHNRIAIRFRQSNVGVAHFDTRNLSAVVSDRSWQIPQYLGNRIGVLQQAAQLRAKTAQSIVHELMHAFDWTMNPLQFAREGAATPTLNWVKAAPEVKKRARAAAAEWKAKTGRVKSYTGGNTIKLSNMPGYEAQDDFAHAAYEGYLHRVTQTVSLEYLSVNSEHYMTLAAQAARNPNNQFIQEAFRNLVVKMERKSPKMLRLLEELTDGSYDLDITTGGLRKVATS